MPTRKISVRTRGSFYTTRSVKVTGSDRARVTVETKLATRHRILEAARECFS